MEEDYNREMELAKEMANKANVVSTKDKENGGNKEKENKEKEEEETKYKNMLKNAKKYDSNQKIQFAVALVEVRILYLVSF